MRTKANQERLVADQLGARGITAYLPLRKEIRRWSDRTKVGTFPLFPGYVFAGQCEYGSQSFKYIPGSCGLLLQSNKPVGCSAKMMEDIRILEASQLQFINHPIMNVGDKVRILRGPLAGMEGLLSRIKNVDRFVINAVLLNQSVSIETNRMDLEII